MLPQKLLKNFEVKIVSLSHFISVNINLVKSLNLRNPRYECWDENVINFPK